MTARDLCQRILFLVLVVIAATGAPPARAGDFGVSPLRLVLDARTRSGAITVSNDGASPLTFQVALARWTEDAAGRDVYRASQDLVYFPRQFAIPPHRNRIIRVGYRNPALGREQAYRLFIEEIPNPGAAQRSGTGVAIALRFGVPIFVQPAQARVRGEIAAVTLAHGAVQVRVRNDGRLHFRIASVRVEALDAHGKPLYARSVPGWYLLAGAERRYRVPLPLAACRAARRLRVEVSGAHVHLSTALDLTAQRCAQAGSADGSG